MELEQLARALVILELMEHHAQVVVVEYSIRQQGYAIYALMDISIIMHLILD